MPLVRDRDVIEDSPWPAPDPAIAADARIVSLDEWQESKQALLRENTPVGVRLTSAQTPDRIADDLERLAVVALEFPTFRDGRAYSSARILRQRYGYQGELRAVGNVLRDQLMFMHRCGFNAFEIAGEDAAAQFRQALAEIGFWYQPTGDRRRVAASLRHGASTKTALGQGQ